jgi:hypothetical protein
MIDGRWLREMAAALLLVTCGACAVPCCVKVHRIRGDIAPADGVNVLFLGDGFSKSELPSFRAAASHLAAQIVATPPFCRVASRMNFYRIDVCDDDGIADGCSIGCPELRALVVSPTFRERAPATVVKGWKKLRSDDLRVIRCQSSPDLGSSGTCGVLWPDQEGEALIHEISQCAPNVTMVVVLANAQLEAGAAKWAVSTTTQNLAVVGVPMQQDLSGNWEVHAGAHALLAHELGHTLGLVDEYIANVSDADPPPADRNVWIPSSVPPWTGGEVPWRGRLSPGCRPELMVPCCGFAVGSNPCQACTALDPADSKCSYVPAVCQDYQAVCSGNPTGKAPCQVPVTCSADTNSVNQLCPALSTCNAQPAAWEGGAFSRLGIYRSSHTCRMQTLMLDTPFCEACLEAMWKRHFCVGLACTSADPMIGPCF